MPDTLFKEVLVLLQALLITDHSPSPPSTAGKIAKILQAGKYAVLTNTTGIFDDNGNLIKSMNAEQVRQYVKKGTISSGMLPKVESALEAVSAGVHNVQIIDGTIEHALLLELFTDEGVGTMIRRT